MGAPIGNQNRAKANRWQKALERALARKADSDIDEGLNKIADKVVELALSGNKDAWNEIAERFGGKVPQTSWLSAPDDEPLPMLVRFVGVDAPGPLVEPEKKPETGGG